jgi:hypothetical protein
MRITSFTYCLQAEMPSVLDVFWGSSVRFVLTIECRIFQDNGFVENIFDYCLTILLYVLGYCFSFEEKNIYLNIKCIIDIVYPSRWW